MSQVLYGEFGSADEAVAAVLRLRALGYRTLEAYTPCAVPELEGLLHTARSRIPWAALAAGGFGAALAYAIIAYCNAYDYPLDVGARPLNSLPADVPIVFETTVLFAACTTFALVLLRSGLPRLHHPVFELEGFERASVDTYWLAIETGERAEPPLRASLQALGAIAVRGGGST